MQSTAAGDSVAAPPGSTAEPRPAAAASAPSGKERRRNERYECAGEVQILRVKEGSGIVIRGEIHNLSLGGCYVETPVALERGAQLAVVLKVNELKLRLIAEVRSVKIDSRFWAGLEFAGMTAQGFESLKALIAAFGAKGDAKAEETAELKTDVKAEEKKEEVLEAKREEQIEAVAESKSPA